LARIEITPEAQEFIREFSETITVKMEICGTCGRTRGEPAVYVGTPEFTDPYHRLEVEGITVYLPKRAVVAKEGLRLSLARWGEEKGILVEGLLA
jgi:hypothetical protein